MFNTDSQTVHFKYSQQHKNELWLTLKEEYQEIGKLGVTLLMRVSARGAGLYLFIPRDIRDVYGIMAGDQIEAKLDKHYRPKPFQDEKG